MPRPWASFVKRRSRTQMTRVGESTRLPKPGVEAPVQTGIHIWGMSSRRHRRIKLCADGHKCLVMVVLECKRRCRPDCDQARQGRIAPSLSSPALSQRKKSSQKYERGSKFHNTTNIHMFLSYIHLPLFPTSSLKIPFCSLDEVLFRERHSVDVVVPEPALLIRDRHVVPAHLAFRHQA